MRTNTSSFSPLFLMLAASLTMSGCIVVGPDYTPPKPNMPAAFAGHDASGDVVTLNDPLSDDAVTRWWDSFNDPVLSGLIERGLAENLDLKLAEERLNEAYALRGISKSRWYPTLDATGSASRSRSSDNTAGRQFSIGNDQTRFSLGLDASWELDVFGGIKRAVEASDADLQAAEEDRRFARVTLAAEVAQAYVDLRQFQQRKAVVMRAIKAQGDTLDLTKSRMDAGLANDLEVAQAQGVLATRESLRPALLTGERSAIYRIAVLLGKNPAQLISELETSSTQEGNTASSESAPVPKSKTPIATGLPSDLLRRRPDIRRAERRIAAASARVGVATADLFPRFSLTGSFALDSEHVDQLLDISSRTWSFGPSVRWNIFDAGKLRRTVDAANSRERQALIQYQSTVLVALEDVEHALVQVKNEQARRATLKRAVDANTRAVKIAEERYRAGVSEFLNVLESQRQLYDSEDQLVQSDAELARSVIALYRALGGGWHD